MSRTRTYEVGALIIVLIIAGAFVGSGLLSQPSLYWVANLSGFEEVPPVLPEEPGDLPPEVILTEGRAIFSLSEDGTELRYQLSVFNIENIRFAHIHLGARGINGPIVAFLYPGPKIEGRFDGMLAEGTITVANLVSPLAGQPLSALIDAIEAGNAYVNVHTDQYPAGEIRGQIY